MEQCQVPADVKGTKSKQSTKILKKMKKNLRPNRSTAQSDRDVTQSETNEDHGEETNMQKDSLTADRELSASNDSLSDISNVEGSEILKKMKKNLRPLRSTAQVGREVNQSEGAEDYGEKTETRQDSLSTHRELSASNDSLSDNTKRPGILKEMKKKLRPIRSTAQSDREASQSESTEDHGEETNTQKDSLTAYSELSASKDSLSDISNLEGPGILMKMKNNLRPVRSTAQGGREVNQTEGTEDFREKTETRQISSDTDSVDPPQTHSSTETELEAPDNTQKKGGKLAGIFRKSPKLAERSLPSQENESTPTELSASNDSLPEVSTKEKGDKLTDWFRRAPKPAERTRPAQENESTRSELSADSESVLDVNTKEKGGMFSGMFRTKSPKPAESTPSAQEDESLQRELSASNDSLSDINTKEKGGIFGGMFRKSPKTSRDRTPAQDSLSIHSELSVSNDSLSDNNSKTARESSQLDSTENHKEETDNQKDKVFGGLLWKIPKDRTATFTSYVTDSNLVEEKGRPDNKQISFDAVSVDPQQAHSTTETELEAPDNTQKKGGKLAGLFRKSPKPAESTLLAQEDESIQSELSASNDSLSDINTKEKGGIFSGMFRSKSPKRSRDPTLAQDNLSAHSELSGSKDSLSDDIQISFDANDVGPPQTHSTTETELEGPDDTQKKGGKLAGLFRKSPKPAESALLAQEDESIESELSASNTNLLDINTKEKGGIFSGMFRSKFPKGSKDPTPAQVSMDTESGTLAGGDEKREESRRPKRKVSFRVTRTLPRTPKITLLPPIQDSEEEELLEKSFEMVELPSVQESSVEVQMVELAPLPSETNPLDTTEDDDGLLDWWRTVEGWNEWNESSNFKEDEEELAIEQAADRVYLGAQLFVRLFNQRGASLQKRILELLELADAADSFHKRALKASMGGRVASVVGSVTTITGLILAPFTFGSSIIVTAVGIGVATAGTITSASAHITDSVHFTLDRKKVEKMIEGYQEEVKDIRECMEFVQQGMHTLQGWNFEKYTDSVAKRALNRNIKHVVKEGARAGKALMINTDRLVSTVQVLSVAGGAAKAAQAISVTTGVMSALFLALDIFFLAKDSHDLRKGAKTKFAKKLREVCKELQDGLLELNKVKTALQKTMDGIEVEEVEEEEEEEEDEEDLALKSDPAKMAQLEEEINQIEQKLDQEVLEKKKEGEGEGRKESRRNDSKQDHVKPQGGKMEKGEKESAKGEKGVRVEKEGKAESEGGKFGIHEMSKGGHQEDGNEDRKKEKREGDIKGEKKREGDIKGEKKREGDIKAEKKREGDEQWKSGKKEGDEQGKKERREQDEWRKKAKIESDEQRKKEPKEGGEQWKYAKKDSVPPPARPRSKAISHSTKETRWEGPDADPKAPPPARPKRCVSQREPLSI
ncbi:uncharacterized protein LOC135260599 isoform X2 [Anguilla rostrata]|uniref:uncharacterized protein LOC135260599 isoform X2 n=1 Tax=Anguilla rostrata TaxID=7938 RepID=UPI0030D09CA6